MFCVWATDGNPRHAVLAAIKAEKEAEGGVARPPERQPPPLSRGLVRSSGKVAASLWGMGCYFGGAES